MPNKEVWKTVEEYPLYEVSTNGMIRNAITKRPLKYRPCKQGYNRVRLYKDKTTKNVLVHRLIAKAFIPNPDNLPIVNHKDENVSNNNVSNLEWCTMGYNNTYGSAQIKRSKSNSKTVCQMDDYGNVISFFSSLKEASAKTGANSAHISYCCNHKRKHAGGYMWAFAKGGDLIAST